MPRMSREQSREQTRQRLLDAAGELFAERGVNGCSVEQIAERAGYSRGALYGNYGSKLGLLAALLEQRTQRELAEIRELMQNTNSTAELMVELRAWNVARAEHLEDWLALRLELLLHALRNPAARPLVAARELVAREAIAAGIAHDFAERKIRPPANPAQLALVLHALEDGMLLQRMLTPDDIDAGIVVDTVELLIDAWAALGPRPTPRKPRSLRSQGATRAGAAAPVTST